MNTAPAVHPPIELEVRDEHFTILRRLAPPSSMPSDLTPGEFVMLPSSGVPQWYVFCDKQRFWDGTAWKLTGTIVPFDPGSMSEAEMYALRRRLLQVSGWI